MKIIIGIFRFVYDFVIGDCWQIAAGVAIVLVAGAVVVGRCMVPLSVVPPLVGCGIIAVVVASLAFTSKDA